MIEISFAVEMQHCSRRAGSMRFGSGGRMDNDVSINVRSGDSCEPFKVLKTGAVGAKCRQAPML